MKLLFSLLLLFIISTSTQAQITDSSFIYFKALELHLYHPDDEMITDSLKEEHEIETILLVLPENVSKTFPKTCSGHNLKIVNYSDLSKLRHKSRKNIDFIEVHNMEFEDGKIIIPIAYRIVVKKWRKTIIGIYIGLYYEVTLGNSPYDIKITRTQNHFE